MKKILILSALVAFTAVGPLHAQKKVKLNTDEQKLGYSMGVLMGQMFSDPMFDAMREDVDLNSMIAGLTAIFEGKTPQMDYNEAMNAFSEYMTTAQERHGELARSESEQFMVANSKRKGVVTLPSGLQYKVVREGDGIQPQDDDRVKVHYRAKLIDGAVVDDSYERNEPAILGLDQVVPGFSEGVKQMNEGAEYIIYVPYDLAYGEQGMGKIKPYQAMIFEVELLEVNPESDYSEGNSEDYEDEEQEEYFEARDAGDMREVKVHDSNVNEYNDMEVRASFILGGNIYVFAEDGMYVLDGNNGAVKNSFLNAVIGGDAEPSSRYSLDYAVFEHKVLGEAYTLIVAEWSNSDGYYTGSDVYLMEKGTVSYLGHMNVVASQYYYEGSSLLWSLDVSYSPGKPLAIRFKDNVMHSPAGERMVFFSDDLYYIVTGGKLVPAGAALNLSYFKMQELKRSIVASAGSTFGYFETADLDGDGQKDVVFTLADEDHETLHVYICKDFKVAKRLSVPFSDSELMMGELRMGTITVGTYIDDEEGGYSIRRYKVINGTIEEIEYTMEY